MSLGGMAIAIGVLVDDAIINVENAYKRLRQNRQKPIEERQSAFTVVFDASKEMQASILNATLIIIVAFIPLVFPFGNGRTNAYPVGNCIYCFIVYFPCCSNDTYPFTM